MVVHEPEIIKYKKVNFMRMKNMKTLFSKQTKVKFNDIDVKSKEYLEFAKNNKIVSPLKDVYNKMSNDLITMKLSTKKKYYGKVVDLTLWGQMSCKQLAEWCETYSKSIYELISDKNPRKVYFDYDILVGEKIEFDDIIENDTFKGILQVITEYLPKAKFSISGSCGFCKKKKSHKLSLHVVVNNYHFKSLEHQNQYMKYFADFIGADKAPYNSNQAFKMPNQIKLNEAKDRKQKIIVDNNYLNHIIQNINEDSILVTKELKKFNNINSLVKLKKSNAKRPKVKQAPKQFYEIEKDLKQPQIHKYHSSALSILKAIPIRPKGHVNNLKYSDYFFVLSFCQLEELNFDTVWEITKGRQSKYDKQYWENIYNGKIKNFNDKIPEKSKKLVKKAKRTKIFNLLSLFYGEIKDIYLEKFKNDQINEDYKFDKVIKTKYINLTDIISVPNKIIIEKLGMGSGKTNNLNLLLRIQKNSSCISLTNRKSLAENQKGEFNRECDDDEIKRIKEVTSDEFLSSGNGFIHYSDKKAKDANRVVCEIESINRFSKKSYDVVIIDEIESLFLSFANEKCHSKRYTENWLAFIKMCQNAKKIYCLDAYISKRTFQFFKDIMPNEQVHVIAKENDKINKKVRMYHSNAYDKFLAKLEECIKANKRICFQYPYKSGKSSYFKQSIDDIKNLITKYGNYKKNQVLNYHGDTDEKKKQELANVNKVWNKSKEGDDIMCVIYNGSISVGVNCNVEYDKLFLTYADHLFARTTIQGSMRFRKFKDNIIECYCYKNLTFDTDFDFKPYTLPVLSFKDCRLMDSDEADQFIAENEDYEIANVAHKHLIDGIKHEQESKGFAQLEYYFKATGYEIFETVFNDEKLDIKKIKNNIEDMICGMDSAFDCYENIPDITKDEYKRLLKIQHAGAYYTEKNEQGEEVSVMCSQMDRYKIKKYAINQMFKSAQDINNESEEPMDKSEEENYEFHTTGVKYELFKKSYILEGFRDIRSGRKCINMVINKDWTLNHTPLTNENRKAIAQHYELGKNWQTKSDYFIKSKIAQCHFIQNVVKLQNGKNRKIIYDLKFFDVFISTFQIFGKPFQDHQTREIPKELCLDDE